MDGVVDLLVRALDDSRRGRTPIQPRGVSSPSQDPGQRQGREGRARTVPRPSIRASSCPSGAWDARPGVDGCRRLRAPTATAGCGGGSVGNRRRGFEGGACRPAWFCGERSSNWRSFPAAFMLTIRDLIGIPWTAPILDYCPAGGPGQIHPVGGHPERVEVDACRSACPVAPISPSCQAAGRFGHIDVAEAEVDVEVRAGPGRSRASRRRGWSRRPHLPRKFSTRDLGAVDRDRPPSCAVESTWSGDELGRHRAVEVEVASEHAPSFGRPSRSYRRAWHPRIDRPLRLDVVPDLGGDERDLLHDSTGSTTNPGLES